MSSASHSLNRLAFRHWLSDLGSAEMRLLLVATLIAAISMSMISTFSDRLTRTMAYRASELVAGDLTLRAPQPLNAAFIEEAKSRSFGHSSAMAFSTMAYANGELQLSRIRAADDSYPLRGNIQIANGPFVNGEFIDRGPTPGNVWVEHRILQSLDISVGDKIEIGDSQFTVEFILQQDADRSGSFFSPFGRILMNLSDVKDTGVISPGSRLLYKEYFAGEESEILDYVDWLSPQLHAAQKMGGIVQSESNVAEALSKAQQYLSLASLVAVLLAGVAIIMASQRYSERHFETSALLRCLGAQQSQITALFFKKLLLTGLLASIVGCTIGFLAHYGLMALMAALLPPDLLPPNAMPVFISGVCALIVLMSFAMTPLLQLRKVSPVRVLRRELAPKAIKPNIYYILAVATLGGLAYMLTAQVKLTLIFVVGLALLALGYGLLAGVLLSVIQKIIHKLPKKLGAGFTQLYRHRYYASSQLGAFAFIFTAIVLVIIVRTDLFARWQASVAEDTPNFFAINILPDVKESFASHLSDAGIESSYFYPVVRGRLSHINDEEALSRSSEEEAPPALRRELSLTWSDQLNPDAEILEGKWWDQLTEAELSEGTLVSVESGLAKVLDIQLGDQLTYTVAGQLIKAKVASIRQVKWDNFRPNFYMVFAPGHIDGFHHTWLNSFYLDAKEGDKLLELNRTFKAVSLIPVEQILNQVRDILRQTTAAVEYILMLVLAAGVLLLFATLLSTLSLRKREAAIYRTLGASSAVIRQLVVFEYVWLGLLSGVLAVLSVEAMSFVLYEQVFDVPWAPHFALWLFTPAAAIAVIVAGGWWAARPVMEAAPTQLLREV